MTESLIATSSAPASGQHSGVQNSGHDPVRNPALPHGPGRQEPTPGRPVVVIGGGISGLTVAYRLARAGLPVRVLEAGDALGGLGVAGEIGGVPIEKFYHCVMPSDHDLLALLGDLGLGEDVSWGSTTMAMLVGHRRYPFNSAIDLLRFTPLRLRDRVRFGAATLALRRLGRGRDLDGVRTEDWMREIYGDRIWKLLLQPLFGAKFGARFGDVPALYVYERLGRESNVAVRGHPLGGYRGVVEALRAGIESAGGVVECGAPVRRVRSAGARHAVQRADGDWIDAAAVVSTVALPVLRGMADDVLHRRLPEVDVDYRGVVNAVFLLDGPLDGHYWAPVIDCGTEFDGVVEMSALTGTARYGGRSLVYVMKYCDRGSSLFGELESVVAARWSAQLAALYPDHFGAGGRRIDDVRVFKAPYVEPVHTVGYGARKPAIGVEGTGVFLATTAQIYPGVTSWNSSVGLADRVAEQVRAWLGADVGRAVDHV